MLRAVFGEVRGRAVTPERILKTLESDLRRVIKSCDEYLKQRTDTGTMWRSTAYQEVLDRIKTLKRRGRK